jgi:hypothetical protein
VPKAKKVAGRWETPSPAPVPAPDVGNALAVRGSRRALSRFVLGTLRRWLYFGPPAALCVAGGVLTHDTGGRVVLAVATVLLLWGPVHRTVVTGRVCLAMARHPWRMFRATVTGAPVEGATIRLELWRRGEPHVYLTAKHRLSEVRREELATGAYGEVWFAGTARGGVVVPSGGADRLLWAARWRQPTPARGRLAVNASKPARPRIPRKPAKPRSSQATLSTLLSRRRRGIGKGLPFQ